MNQIQIETFFHSDTSTFSYIVTDPSSRTCAIVDPVLDYDPKSGSSSTAFAEKQVEFIQQNGLTLTWILETHVHADHLTALPFLQESLGGSSVTGDQVSQIQQTFGKLFNLDTSRMADGHQFDRLVSDGDTLQLGELEIQVLHTPGHTPSCVSYLFKPAQQPWHLFVGDTLFMPDTGTARCDFPGGDAGVLFQSVQRILSLPDDTQLHMCHDYAPGGREHQSVTTVAEQKQHNIHVHQPITEAEFIEMRNSRDAGLAMPVLILPSVQVNMLAGKLPMAEDNGIQYLKIPLNQLGH